MTKRYEVGDFCRCRSSVWSGYSNTVGNTPVFFLYFTSQ